MINNSQIDKFTLTISKKMRRMHWNTGNSFHILYAPNLNLIKICVSAINNSLSQNSNTCTNSNV